jgi:hypothetical protein
MPEKGYIEASSPQYCCSSDASACSCRKTGCAPDLRSYGILANTMPVNTRFTQANQSNPQPGHRMSAHSARKHSTLKWQTGQIPYLAPRHPSAIIRYRNNSMPRSTRNAEATLHAPQYRHAYMQPYWRDSNEKSISVQISMLHLPDGRSKTPRLVHVKRCNSHSSLADLYHPSRPSKSFYFDRVTWFDSPDANVPISLTICWPASSKKK